jgi:nucleoside-diphosphate-sugar epimerase
MDMDYQESFKGKNVLITGGLGFIGSNLAIELVRLGSEVTLVDSMIPEYGGNFFNIKGVEDKVKVNIADIRDEHSMKHIVKGRDYIFNLAGTLSHIDSMVDPYTDLEINCRSQLSILEVCRKNNKDAKIVFAGTRGQYGKAVYLPVDEKHPLQPVDVNGINNTAGEWYHILYNNVHGIRAASLRLTNTYGPRHQMRHSRQGFLNWFVRLALDNQKIQIYGKGTQLRDFNYVGDVVKAFLVVAASDKVNGKVFNLGSGRPVSVADAAELIVSTAGSGNYQHNDFPADKLKIEIGDYYADFGRIRDTVGWKPETGLESGLKETIDFYRRYKKYYW